MSSVHISQTSYRLIPSHFPPIALFENLLDPGELDAAYALEALTNDRIREQVGQISIVDKNDRIVGPGTTPIMAAFTHIGFESRFSNGDFGVYYAGLSLATAMEESAFSRARFLRATNEAQTVITMRCYSCMVDAQLDDVRADTQSQISDDFTHPQALGKRAKYANKFGLIYSSVRHANGECVALLKPKALIPPATQAGTYQYFWDGNRMSDIVEITKVR